MQYVQDFTTEFSVFNIEGRLKVFLNCLHLFAHLLKTSPFILYIVFISYVLTFLQEYFSKAKLMGL